VILRLALWNNRRYDPAPWHIFEQDPVSQRDLEMKKDIHPEYNFIVFRDTSTNWSILTRSTMKSDTTVKWNDGNTYPVVDLEISSASHPFYTGKQKLVDTAGRIEKFKKKYAKN